MLPNIERANAVLIGGNWTVVSKAYPSDIDGWLTLETARFVKISVRESCIEAIRYQDLPTLPKVPANMNWGLG